MLKKLLLNLAFNVVVGALILAVKEKQSRSTRTHTYELFQFCLDQLIEVQTKGLEAYAKD